MFKEVGLKRLKPEAERRKWPRLPIAIPVFVRSRDEKGKEILEFATALNISAGGALVAVRRSLPLSAQVLLEIPSAPLAVANSLPKAARNLRARTMRVTHADGYHLVGLKFARPLVSSPLPASLPYAESLFRPVKTFSHSLGPVVRLLASVCRSLEYLLKNVAS